MVRAIVDASSDDAMAPANRNKPQPSGTSTVDDALIAGPSTTTTAPPPAASSVAIIEARARLLRLSATRHAAIASISASSVASAIAASSA